VVAWFQQYFVPDGCCTSPSTYITAAVIALLLTAVGKGGFGGLGALSVPILMMVIRPEHATLAVAMWAPMLIICDLCTLPFYARECDWRPILLLAPWTTLGLCIGRLCLDWFRATPAAGDWLKVTIGALSILFALSQAARYFVARRAQRQIVPWQPAWWHAIPFGLAAGISTMIAHAAGSIFAMFLIPQQLDRRLFVGTSTRYYLIFNTVKLPFFMATIPAFTAGSPTTPQGSYLTWESLRLILWLIPLVPLGVFAGNWLNTNFSNRLFNVAVNVLLALTGVWLIYSNLPWVKG
jgi:uncharacterized protein